MNSPDKVQFERSASQDGGYRVRDGEPVPVDATRESASASSKIPKPSKRSGSGLRAELRILFFTRVGHMVLFVIGAVLLLPYTGFCLFEFRFLSDNEFIDAAIRHVLTSVAVIETPDGEYAQFVPKERVGYGSLEDFHRLNPNCCKIVPHDRRWISLRHELCGQAAKSVHVTYMVRYVNDSGGISNMEAVGQRAVSNCGHVLNPFR
jgi:hypothetical protein